MKELLNILMDFGKVRITLFVAISGSVGYILSAGDVSTGMLLPLLGIFILSFGSGRGLVGSISLVGRAR